MGLVIHVVNHTAQSRSRRLTPEDREDLVSQVFVTFVKDDLALLRQFRGESSLATYLTVVARRSVVNELLRHKSAARLSNGAAAEPRRQLERGCHRRRGRTAGKRPRRGRAAAGGT